jgi:hypothetical protein
MSHICLCTPTWSPTCQMYQDWRVRLFKYEQMLRKRLKKKTYLGLEMQMRLEPFCHHRVPQCDGGGRSEARLGDNHDTSWASVVVVGWGHGVGIVVVVFSSFRVWCFNALVINHHLCSKKKGEKRKKKIRTRGKIYPLIRLKPLPLLHSLSPLVLVPTS